MQVKIASYVYTMSNERRYKSLRDGASEGRRRTRSGRSRRRRRARTAAGTRTKREHTLGFAEHQMIARTLRGARRLPLREVAEALRAAKGTIIADTPLYRRVQQDLSGRRRRTYATGRRILAMKRGGGRRTPRSRKR